MEKMIRYTDFKHIILKIIKRYIIKSDRYKLESNERRRYKIMKFKTLLLFLLAAIVIGGCSSTKGGRNLTTSQQSLANNFDTTKYEGKWISSDYQIIQMDGYKAHFGSELYLKHKDDGIIEMSMYDISAPPASRIASIEKDIKISSEGIGSFTFEDDGWGSHGSGTIELRGNQVIIVIDSRIEEGKYADWRVYSGKRVFIREETPSEGLK